MSPRTAIGALWILWVASWAVGSLWTAPTAKAAGRSERPFRLLMIAGALLFVLGSAAQRTADFQLWNLGTPALWALVAVQAAAFTFTWWARLHLGRLWSSDVVLKEAHRVVDTGPYAIVRHPIYTGVIVALIVTALWIGTLFAIAGLCLMVRAFWLKARLEERFLSAEMGQGAYEAYARRVPMLVPFGLR